MESEILFEPIRFPDNKGILLARALINPQQGKVQVSALNSSSAVVTLSKNSIVGCKQPIKAATKVNVGINDKHEQALPEHLIPIIDKISPKVTESQKQSIKELLIDFQDIFVGPDGKLGRTNLAKHVINTGDAKPIKLPPRRAHITQRKVIETEIQKMLDQDIIEPNESPWATPILLVKKDNSVRFCLDFRRINSVTKKDAYPLPRIDTCLDSLGGSEWYNTLDMASGYWQVEMDEQSKEKTAFTSHMGLFQFNVLPFGLTNAGACFERLMEFVLKGYQWKRCLCYIDDVIVFGNTFENTLTNLRLVFQRFREANLKLKPSKCSLFQDHVLFLGHMISSEGITCDPSKIETVQKWPVPTNVHEIRSFLGLAGYCRRFIPQFSEIASPLTELTKKGRKFAWSLECQEAFEKNKRQINFSPNFELPK